MLYEKRQRMRNLESTNRKVTTDTININSFNDNLNAIINAA